MVFTTYSSSVIPIGGPAFHPPAFEAASPTSEASSSRFSLSSSSSSSLELSREAMAHLDYARQMAQHTAAMWQRERLNIEKAKLDGTWNGAETSRTNGSAKPVDPSANKKSPESESEREATRTIFGFELRGRSRRRRE